MNVVAGLYDGFRAAQEEFGVPLWGTIQEAEGHHFPLMVGFDEEWLGREGFLA